MPQRPFSNRWPHPNHRVRDILKWKLGRQPLETAVLPEAPDEPAPWVSLDPASIKQSPLEGWRVIWLGHASFLLQGCGKSILIDPVFSDYCSPVPIAALKRKIPPPCTRSELPPIDAVLLTHNHYDHLDISTLRTMGDVPEILISEGNADWLGKKLGRKIRELAWDESVSLLPGIAVSATPAQHFSSRTPFDRNRSHWCGFVIEGGGFKLWHAGDSGYSPDFVSIGNLHGPIDFAMIPIGAYKPEAIMRPIHMNPEEAVQAFIDARCRSAVGMHWGTFALTDEPMGEPPLRLKMEMEKRQLPLSSFTTPSIGEILRISRS